MPKLTNLKGAEVLPKEKEYYKPTPEQVGNGAYYDLKVIKGHNQCVQSLDKIGVVGRLDREKLAEELYREFSDWKYGGLMWRKLTNNTKQHWLNSADNIISNQSSLIELELVVEKE